MHKFVIEREFPGAGNLTERELKAIAQTSNDTVKALGVPYHWIETLVVGDKMYCIHVADDAETIREHARRAGFPADSVQEVKAVLDPTTAG